MDQVRNGIFTSSQIYKLMGAPKPFQTYVQEKNWERKSGGAISVDVSSHPLSWGRVMEGYVYEKHIEFDYELSSQETTVHPSGLWCGTKDILKPGVVGDIKCPSSRGEFFKLSDILLSKSISLFRDEKPEYYWQLVSNSILENVPNAELIVWMPYESEYDDIIEYVELIDDLQNQLDIQWVVHTPQERLPHIKEGFEYKNVVRFEFEVPFEDKISLKSNVEKASKLLLPWTTKNNNQQN